MDKEKNLRATKEQIEAAKLFFAKRWNVPVEEVKARRDPDIANIVFKSEFNGEKKKRTFCEVSLANNVPFEDCFVIKDLAAFNARTVPAAEAPVA